MNRKYIERVWVDEYAVYAKTTDGLLASYKFEQWPRLRDASNSQRQDFILSYSGIHWPSIDEDLSFEGMFHDAGLCDITDTEDSVCYCYPYNTDADNPLPTAAEETNKYGE